MVGIKTMTNYGQRRFVKDPSFASQEAIDELILVSIGQQSRQASNAYVLNEVAGRIWTLIDGERRVEDITGTIAEEFEVSADDLESDIVAFFKRLEQMGVVSSI